MLGAVCTVVGAGGRRSACVSPSPPPLLSAPPLNLILLLHLIPALLFNRESPLSCQQALAMPWPCNALGSAACERFAWYVYDWSNSAFTTSALAMFAPILYSNLFGPSFFSYYISMSVIAQCVVFIAVSAFADYGSGRKLFFIGFSLIGCLCTALMATISSSSDKTLAAALLVLANVCYGASFVFYNAYIPFLAQRHEHFLAAHAADKPVLQQHQQHQLPAFPSHAVYAGCAAGRGVPHLKHRLHNRLLRRHHHDAHRRRRRVPQRGR